MNIQELSLISPPCPQLTCYLSVSLAAGDIPPTKLTWIISQGEVGPFPSYRTSWRAMGLFSGVLLLAEESKGTHHVKGLGTECVSIALVHWLEQCPPDVCPSRICE